MAKSCCIYWPTSLLRDCNRNKTWKQFLFRFWDFVQNWRLTKGFFFGFDKKCKKIGNSLSSIFKPTRPPLGHILEVTPWKFFLIQSVELNINLTLSRMVTHSDYIARSGLQLGAIQGLIFNIGIKVGLRCNLNLPFFIYILVYYKLGIWTKPKSNIFSWSLNLHIKKVFSI